MDVPEELAGFAVPPAPKSPQLSQGEPGDPQKGRAGLGLPRQPLLEAEPSRLARSRAHCGLLGQSHATPPSWDKKYPKIGYFEQEKAGFGALAGREGRGSASRAAPRGDALQGCSPGMVSRGGLQGWSPDMVSRKAEIRGHLR